MFTQQGMGPVIARERLLGVANRLVERQAGMLAYNDASWILGIMFLVIMPLVFLFPGKKPASTVKIPPQEY